MSDIAIRAENISKQYRLGTVGTGAMAHDLNRWWHKIRGKEDPYLTVGGVNDRSVITEDEYVWSLKDINFEIKKGDAVGIIGKNGAGKSTLLKILSQVTAPTTGSIKVNGRIASLLEVGTGFHPELTGRENIFLNGAILGMTKAEIKSKLDEIIDFSGVAKYVDTPVKRYSSGMMVRLGFAVAAHLEPEILIVDEVLAVGDAEFQKKCLGKMNDVNKQDGRTVLFVSHNMAAVMNLCNRGLLLKNGSILKNDSIKDIINTYSKISNEIPGKYYIENANKECFIKEISIKENPISFDNNINIDFTIESLIQLRNLSVGVAIKDLNGVKIFSSVSSSHDFLKGISKISIIIPSKTLLRNTYNIDAAVYIRNGIVFDYVSDGLQFTIADYESDFAKYDENNVGYLNVKCEWSQLKSY